MSVVTIGEGLDRDGFDWTDNDLKQPSRHRPRMRTFLSPLRMRVSISKRGQTQWIRQEAQLASHDRHANHVHHRSAEALIELWPICLRVKVRLASPAACGTLLYKKSLGSRAIFRRCSPMDGEKFSSDLSKCMNRPGAKTSSVVSRGALPTRRSA